LGEGRVRELIPVFETAALYADAALEAAIG